MMKLVVLALCLFVAVAYASPVFEEETAPERETADGCGTRVHILRVPVAVPAIPTASASTRTPASAGAELCVIVTCLRDIEGFLRVVDSGRAPRPFTDRNHQWRGRFAYLASPRCPLVRVDFEDIPDYDQRESGLRLRHLQVFTPDLHARLNTLY
ncbi:hypothetical protein EVAR_50454_1 [Eumeta japonica]|uniref:Uncharacterized protein n=1 Tax=Eumeta variegata TaxID=151549 RepID=A0A4C1XWI4_EUMVA|nr:hypothetical protein EVAR_50454_1 [Eumeta japonica]